MTCHRPALLAFACIVTTPALAQIAPSVAIDPAPETRPEPATENTSALRSEWIVDVGAASIYAPAFLGSNDYQLLAGPMFSVRYKDRVFLSAGGIGVDLLKSDKLRAGPVIKFQMARRENNDNVLRIAGTASTALRGLGDVGFTPEVGGYAEYRLGMLAAKAEVRKGLGGHDGVIGEVSLRAVAPLTTTEPGTRPITISLGTRASFVDSTYNNAYFGVTAAQSIRSGLRQYTADGGLMSYGMNTALMVPLMPKLTASLIGGYDRLAGDAGRSPLVVERGSRDQFSVGLGLTYRFGR